MSTVLTIAGFDPSSGAGITADLAVFSAHGLFGTSAITSLTVQSTVGVRSVHAVDGGLLRATLDGLEEDLPADGIKIGMLGTAASVAVVVEFLEDLRRAGRRPRIVLDPVLRSSSGRALLEVDGVDMLRNRLLPLVDWATPNVEELAVLMGVSGGLAEGSPRSELAGLARQLGGLHGGLGLVVTGGDRNPPDDLVLVSAEAEEVWLSGARIETRATHGTGCAFSSALLSRLVLGEEPLSAARSSKHYVAEAMAQAVPRGRGRGPMHLRWPLRLD